MHFALLVYENPAVWSRLPEAEKRRVSDACHRWHHDLVQRGHGLSATGLYPPSTSRTVRRNAGELQVVDGPFAETKEVLGGFELVDCRDLAQAEEFARTFPGLDAGLAIEVRRVMTDAEELARWRTGAATA